MTESSNTPLREGTEFDVVRRMLGRWGDVARGIGDDAAVVSTMRSGSLVVSTDASVENVHFRRGWLEPTEIGYRATAAALSDLAAMAATPTGLVIAITLPENWAKSVEAIAEGIGEAARAASAPIIGGDLSDGRDLAIVVTVFGTAERPLRRSGARQGDHVYVTGELGGPGAAVAALKEGKSPSRADRARFAHPVPRLHEARWLAAKGVNAATDISDGLAADLANIAAASDLSISLSLDLIPIISGVTPADAASSGEEYELAVTSSNPLDTRAFESEFGLKLTEVGRVEDGSPVIRVFDRGAPVPTPSGYLHFTRHNISE